MFPLVDFCFKNVVVPLLREEMKQKLMKQREELSRN